MDEAEKERRVDTLRFQINELERAKIKEGEEEELAARRSFLRNSEKFIAAVEGAHYSLSGDDSGDGAMGLLRQALEHLAPVRGLDESYEELCRRLEAAYSEVYDLAYTIEDKREDFDFSPTELDEVEGRMDQLYRLKKKYGPTVGKCWLIWISAGRNWMRLNMQEIRCCSWKSGWQKRKRLRGRQRRCCRSAEKLLQRNGEAGPDGTAAA